ncbi:MAG: hypothetical protein HXY21_04555 [Parvularculaceae bacterium]|nr:hypothetical protein [Parvularculaceae bacterium]
MISLKSTLLAAGALAGAANADKALAQSAVPFSKHDIYFELNATDGDIGLHGILDGDSWKVATIRGPGGAFNVLRAVPNQASPEFGMTELFFESNEPPLEERSFAELITLFPPGVYDFVGKRAEDNAPMFAQDVLSAAMPCPPVVPTPKIIDGDLMMRWRPRAGSYDPDTGVCSTGSAVSVAAYQIVVELEDTQSGFVRKFSADLPPGARRIETPDELLLGVNPSTTEAKAEVLVIAPDGNRTAIEVEFDL